MKNPTIVFTGPKRVEIQDHVIPVPKADELLVETKLTLISIGTEMAILLEDYPPDSRFAQYATKPFIPGYNNIGVVVEVGPGVVKSWIGKRVATEGNHRRFNAIPLSETRVIENDALLDEHAVFFTIAEIVMNGVRMGGVQWGEAVVIYGLGLLGQFAVQLCQLCGARPIFAVDVADSRLAKLLDRTGIIPVNPKREDVVSVVEKNTRKRMADVVFEVTGNPHLIPDEFKPLKRQGRFVVLSSPWGKTLFSFHDFCNSPSYTIIGAHKMAHPKYETPYNPWTRMRHAELFFDFVVNNELSIAPLISHREHYTKSVQLYEMLLADRSQAMGVLLEWSR